MAKITREQYLANKKFYDRRMGALQEQQKRLNKIVKGAKQEKGYFLKRAVVIKGDKARGYLICWFHRGKRKAQSGLLVVRIQNTVVTGTTWLRRRAAFYVMVSLVVVLGKMRRRHMDR